LSKVHPEGPCAWAVGFVVACEKGREGNGSASGAPQRSKHSLRSFTVGREVLAGDEQEIWARLLCPIDPHQLPHARRPRRIVGSDDEELLSDGDRTVRVEAAVEDLDLRIEAVDVNV
jgi:hypothetical protein